MMGSAVIQKKDIHKNELMWSPDNSADPSTPAARTRARTVRTSTSDDSICRGAGSMRGGLAVAVGDDAGNLCIR